MQEQNAVCNFTANALHSFSLEENYEALLKSFNQRIQQNGYKWVCII